MTFLKLITSPPCKGGVRGGCERSEPEASEAARLRRTHPRPLPSREGRSGEISLRDCRRRWDPWGRCRSRLDDIPSLQGRGEGWVRAGASLQLRKPPRLRRTHPRPLPSREGRLREISLRNCRRCWDPEADADRGWMTPLPAREGSGVGASGSEPAASEQTRLRRTHPRPLPSREGGSREISLRGCRRGWGP
jgi:hypothetical protein